jgi:hypothetical protein
LHVARRPGQVANALEAEHRSSTHRTEP